MILTQEQAQAIAKKIWGERGGAWDRLLRYGERGCQWLRFEVGESYQSPKENPDLNKLWEPGTAPHRAVSGMSDDGFYEAFAYWFESPRTAKRKAELRAKFDAAVKEVMP